MNKTIISSFSDIRYFLKAFLPDKKDEKYLFWGLLLFYLSYSVFVTFTTSIVDNISVGTDLYFSYDNPLILEHGRTQISGHPLLIFFYYPFVLIGNGLVLLTTVKVKTLFFIMLSSAMISLSCVYIFRYIRQIIELKRFTAFIFTLFFAFFSTNLILAFTPESFTLSALFLSFNVYYNSSFIKRGISPPFISNVILADFFLGGVTLTNMAKGVIPVLFFKEKKASILKKIIILGAVFFIILLALQIFSALVLDKNYIGSIFAHKDNFTDESLTGMAYLQMIFSHFFGAPIFLSEIFSYNTIRNGIPYLVEGDYRLWWQYLFMSLICVFVVTSLIRNYKEPFVQMIFLLFLVDIVIHCIIRFGINEPFIYGAHWIYCVPLLLGWLSKKLKDKQAKVFLIIISCMFVALVINNLVRLFDFINLAQQIYPVQ
ncbi:MAG: DUF6080 domain-containing protein [Prevotella sp.]|jgi:hypothetical protein|nr:DUF6080 domain-containing protein [Prevotella sp.]